MRLLQKKLAEEVTAFVHNKEELEKAVLASNILFGKSTSEDLKSLDKQTFLDVFDGVPQAIVSQSDIENGLDMIAALAAKTNFLSSNGEARRALKENAISVNKEKVKEDYLITSQDLIAHKYVLLQRGKKNYFLLNIE
jgi:tyrosyl-tRNA synthetase